MTLEPEDEDILDALTIMEIVPGLEAAHQRLDRLAAAGYVILAHREALRADIPLGPVYRLTVRGRAYLENRKRKGN
jgi:hypothetical protein